MIKNIPLVLTTEAESHALNEAWSLLWGTKRLGHNLDRYEKVVTFTSLECFLEHYHFSKPPSELEKDYRMGVAKLQYSMQKLIARKAGFWTLQVRRHEPKLDSIWEEIVFRTVGSTNPSLVGAFAVVKNKEVQFQVWCIQSDQSCKEQILGQLYRVYNKIYYSELSQDQLYKPY